MTATTDEPAPLAPLPPFEAGDPRWRILHSYYADTMVEYSRPPIAYGAFMSAYLAGQIAVIPMITRGEELQILVGDRLQGKVIRSTLVPASALGMGIEETAILANRASMEQDVRAGLAALDRPGELDEGGAP